MRLSGYHVIEMVLLTFKNLKQTNAAFSYVRSILMINVLGWNVIEESLTGKAYSDSPWMC